MSDGPTHTAWTIARLLSWTQDHLHQRGQDAPRLCAEILLAHVLGCERIHLYTRFEEVPSDEARARFRALIREAAAGRPIAYLTGTKEFFSLTFEVSPAVLIPRPETEILVERTLALLRRQGGERGATPDAADGGRSKRILDLGTGSGCIAVALARHLPGAHICASDVSEAALGIARRNAARHGVADRIAFRCGDLLAPWSGETFDLIVSNPPYIATGGAPIDAHVCAYEPHVALFAGTDGLDVIRRLLAEAPARLSAGGHVLMEMAFDQAAAVRGLLSLDVWEDIATYRDAAGHERVLHVRRPAAKQCHAACA